MTGIVTNRPLRRELESRRYCLLRAADLSVSEDLQQAWLNLSIYYADLPLDKYLPDGGKYRYRRYGRFRYLPCSGELTRLPHSDYVQSAGINRVTGGIVRQFAPLLETTFDNPFLHELIRFDFRQFPVSAGLRDAAEFVTAHLAEMVNVAGGDVSIYDDDKVKLGSFRLEQVLDSYLFHDASLWHEAQPIRPADNSHRAIRSILTFDYQLADDSR